MASKHDAKRAQENFWVMQQNLAKQKGGRAGFTPRAPKLAKPRVVAAPAVETTAIEPEALSAVFAPTQAR